MNFNFKHSNKEDNDLKKLFEHGLSPSRASMKDARKAFMNEVSVQFGKPIPSPWAFHHFARYSMAVVAVIIFLNGGALIYADTKDVPANHVLYSFKRAAESVELTFASAEARPELEVKFIERRTRELDAYAQADVEVMNQTEPAANNRAFTADSAAKMSMTMEAQAPELPPVTVQSETEAKIQAELKANLKKHINSVEKTVQAIPEKVRPTKKILICNQLKSIKANAKLMTADATTSAEVDQKIDVICNKPLPEQKLELPGTTASSTPSQDPTTIIDDPSVVKPSPRPTATTSVKTNTTKDVLEGVKTKVIGL